MRIDPNDFYVIVINNELVVPDCFDFVMDYWTAETVQAFIQTINNELDVTIEKAQFTDMGGLSIGGDYE